MKAVLFDFDGTLANTLPLCFQAFQSVFHTFDGRTVSSDEVKRMFGPSETGIIHKHVVSENKEAAIEHYYEIYATHHHQFVSDVEDIKTLLNKLKKKGIQLGIVTGKARRSLDLSLEALGMNHIFAVTITGDDVVNPKPHPEGIEKARSTMGIEPHETAFVGDSDADIEAGLSAHVHTFGVTWLPDYTPSPFQSKPHKVFDRVQPFVEYVTRK